jgi:hypothetical protein
MNAHSVECKAYLCIASFGTTPVFVIECQLPLLLLRGELCWEEGSAPDNFVEEHLWNGGIRRQLQRAHDLGKAQTCKQF